LAFPTIYFLTNSELVCVILFPDKMGSNALPYDIMDSSEDELQALEQMNIDIPECEGLLRPM